MTNYFQFGPALLPVQSMRSCASGSPFREVVSAMFGARFRDAPCSTLVLRSTTGRCQRLPNAERKLESGHDYPHSVLSKVLVAAL
jgi:hypothetical protein